MRIAFKMLSLIQPKTVPEVAERVRRKQNIEATKLELNFIRKLIYKCSISDLTTSTTDQIQEKDWEEQQIILLDELFDCISSYSENSEEDEEHEEVAPKIPKFSVWNISGQDLNKSSSSLSSGASVTRKLARKPKREEEEVRLDLEIRVERGLSKTLFYSVLDTCIYIYRVNFKRFPHRQEEADTS
jgi:hypothetical protein